MDKQTVFFEDYHELIRNVWESGLELGDVEWRTAHETSPCNGWWDQNLDLRFDIATEL